MPLLRHLSVRNASHQLLLYFLYLLYFWPYCIVFFSCILPFSSIFSYISKNSSLQSFSSHEFLFFGFSGDYILLNFSENSTKNIDNKYCKYNIPFRQLPFSLVISSSLIFRSQVRYFQQVLCYFICYWVTTCLEITMQV